MYALAKHLVLELRDCDRAVLDDQPFLRRALHRAAQELGVTVLGESFHRFEPQGVSGILFVAESHLAIHTWPEHGYAAVDIFTCGDSVHFEAAAQLIIEELRAKNPAAIEMSRGVIPSAERALIQPKRMP
ncbi:MAG: adenosylmethionine decarboxylase [Chloroflexi bacterium]|nr:adenosylmethionine decarboxylase [Chloroflexota bacterium]